VKPSSTPTLAPQPAPGHQALSGYIRARFDEFSRSQKDVAQYIVDHRDEYRRQVGGGAVNGSAPAPSSAPLFSLDHTEFEAALATDHVNVEDTAHKVSRSDVQGAIDAIVSAEKVLIAGTDQMAFFASYLRHLLMLLDVRAEVVASPSQEALGRLSRIDDRTLVVGLSAGRPHPLITRTMKLARHRKATTLAITDATLSEVAKLARIRLYYSSNTPAFVRSHTALLSIIQALAYGVYARDAQSYDVRIKAFRLK
jgi:DNA-binding MurR/RpiR family transcriptional regulator